MSLCTALPRELHQLQKSRPPPPASSPFTVLAAFVCPVPPRCPCAPLSCIRPPPARGPTRLPLARWPTSLAPGPHELRVRVRAEGSFQCTADCPQSPSTEPNESDGTQAEEQRLFLLAADSPSEFDTGLAVSTPHATTGLAGTRLVHPRSPFPSCLHISVGFLQCFPLAAGVSPFPPPWIFILTLSRNRLGRNSPLASRESSIRSLHDLASPHLHSCPGRLPLGLSFPSNVAGEGAGPGWGPPGVSLCILPGRLGGRLPSRPHRGLCRWGFATPRRAALGRSRGSASP